jgi:hypothetical protein
VRGRTTLGATVVVAVALLVGAFSFYGVLSASIHGSTERAAEQRLDELAERVGGPGRDGIDAIDDEIVQLLGPDGSVRAARVHAPPRRRRPPDPDRRRGADARRVG